MTTYNVSDYQPGSGKIVKSDGSVINEGDGYNSDGSQNVVITGSSTAKINKYQSISMTGTSGSVAAWTPSSGKKFRLLHFTLSVDAAGVYSIRDGAGTNVLYAVSLTANSTITITLPLNGILSATANNPVQFYYPAVTGNAYLTLIGSEE